MSVKNLKILAICLLAVCGLAVSLAFLKTTKIVLEPKPSQAMKGAESGGGRYMKEESFYERYGVNPEGLVLWLDQSDPRSYGNASTWYDLSGKNNHGTQTTAASQPAIVSGSGLAGYARSFDGSNDYVDITSPAGSSLDITGDETFVAWVYASMDAAVSATRRIVDKGGNMFGYQANVARINFGDSTGFVYAVKNIRLGWHHIVAVKSGDTVADMKIYVDGVDQGALTEVGTWDGWGSSATSFKIGARFDLNSSYYWQGLIDDVQIFSRALTAAEIQRLYLVDKPRHGGM